MKTFILSLTLFASFCLSACSDSAIDAFKSAAEEGDPIAQDSLGHYYLDNYRHRDYEQALKWFQKSAIQGNKDAQYQLGYCYY